MTCNKCNNTGKHFQPLMGGATIEVYCDCKFGKNRKSKDLRRSRRIAEQRIARQIDDLRKEK